MSTLNLACQNFNTETRRAQELSKQYAGIYKKRLSKGTEGVRMKHQLWNEENDARDDVGETRDCYDFTD